MHIWQFLVQKRSTLSKKIMNLSEWKHCHAMYRCHVTYAAPLKFTGLIPLLDPMVLLVSYTRCHFFVFHISFFFLQVTEGTWWDRNTLSVFKPICMHFRFPFGHCFLRLDTCHWSTECCCLTSLRTDLNQRSRQGFTFDWSYWCLYFFVAIHIKASRLHLMITHGHVYVDQICCHLKDINPAL